MNLDFAVVGPQRSGTTWTYEYLLTHPEVFVSTLVKESRYFDLAFDRGEDWYESLFEGATPGQVIGEVAPTYFHDPDARDRLLRRFPQCTVIVILREPMARAVSLHNHLRRTGAIPPDEPLTPALDSEPLIVESSRYATHVAAWRAMSDSVHVMRFDDLESDPDGFCSQLVAALGVTAHAPRSSLHRGASVEPRSYAVSRAVATASRSLRRMGANRVVNLGKRLGIKERLLGRRPAETAIDRRDAAELWRRIGPDIVRLETEHGFDLDPWRAAWREAGIEV